MAEITEEDAVAAMRPAHELADAQQALTVWKAHSQRQKEAYCALQGAYAALKKERDEWMGAHVDLDQRHSAVLDTQLERDKGIAAEIDGLQRELADLKETLEKVQQARIKEGVLRSDLRTELQQAQTRAADAERLANQMRGVTFKPQLEAAEQERNRLRADNNNLRRTQVQCQDELAYAQVVNAQLTERLKEAKDDLEKARSSWRGTKNELRSAMLELTTLRSRLRWLTSELDGLRRNLSDKNAEISRLLREQRQMRGVTFKAQTLEEARAELQAERSRVRLLAQERDQLLDRVNGIHR